MTEGRLGPGRLALAVTILGIGFLALRPATDPDFGWHLANGRHLFDGVLLGGLDVYSWTAHGAPWVAHEWLPEAALAALNDGPGPAAVSLAVAAIVAAAFALVALRLRRRGISRPVTLVTVLLGFAATLVSMGVRLQVLELLYLAATMLATDAWFDGRLTRRPLWLLAAAGALIWANTHGSFPLLLAILGITAVAAFVGRDRRWPEMAVAAAVTAVVPLANPWGTALYGFAGQSLTSGVTGRLVQEWQPPDLASASFWPFVVALALAVVGALGVAGPGILRRAGAAPGSHAAGQAGIAAPPTKAGARWLADLFVSAAILVLAMRSGRHVILFGVAAAPLVAVGLATLGRAASGALGSSAPATLSRLRPRRPGASPPPTLTGASRDALNAAALVAIATVLAVAAVTRIGPEAQGRAVEGTYPTALLPALDAAVAVDPAVRIFNEYTWGGFLIAQRPDLPVFIDGRSEVYGDAQLERYSQIAAGGPSAPTTLQSLGVGLVLVKSDAPLARSLLAAGGWRKLAGDGVGVLLAGAAGRP